MANVLGGNPAVIDTASGSTLTGNRFIQEIQWIDDNADIADDDDLSITINGATIAVKIQLTANTVNDCCVWRMGPWSKPIAVTNFIVNTIDHGVLLVFLA